LPPPLAPMTAIGCCCTVSCSQTVPFGEYVDADDDDDLLIHRRPSLSPTISTSHSSDGAAVSPHSPPPPPPIPPNAFRQRPPSITTTSSAFRPLSPQSQQPQSSLSYFLISSSDGPIFAHPFFGGRPNGHGGPCRNAHLSPHTRRVTGSV
jgi:hypothetical protein